MASHLVFPKTGAVALPSGSYGLFQSFDVDESVMTEDVTAYGIMAYGANATNGTPNQVVNVNGFAQAGASSTSPGFGDVSAGAAATLTFETSTTMTGTYIVRRRRASHSRIRGAVSVSWEMLNGGDITTTWAST